MTVAEERRAFVRANHPDLGGDPETFVTGLLRLDRPAQPGVTFVRRRRGLRRVRPAGSRLLRLITRARTPPRVR